MTASPAARRHRVFRSRRNFCAASARSEKFKFTGWADFVEKLFLDRRMIY
jgi:hypothetical protein